VHRLAIGAAMILLPMALLAACGAAVSQSSSSPRWVPPKSLVLPGWLPAVLPSPSVTTSWVERDHPFVPQVVDCSSIDTCQAIAADGSAGVTHDRGVSWQAEAFPKGTQPILQDYSLIACPSVLRCFGAGWAAGPNPSSLPRS